MKKQEKAKLTELLYKQILSDLIKENEFHKTGFSKEELEKVASKRTLEKLSEEEA
tara:strand:- start:44 stop:208 length:165 start_codon:yes stop_codon:yes gene_type:complete